MPWLLQTVLKAVVGHYLLHSTTTVSWSTIILVLCINSLSSFVAFNTSWQTELDRDTSLLVITSFMNHILLSIFATPSWRQNLSEIIVMILGMNLVDHLPACLSQPPFDHLFHFHLLVLYPLIFALLNGRKVRMDYSGELQCVRAILTGGATGFVIYVNGLPCWLLYFALSVWVTSLTHAGFLAGSSGFVRTSCIALVYVIINSSWTI